MSMSAVLSDRSFAQNIGGLLVAALIGLVVLLAPSAVPAPSHSRSLHNQEMSIIEGKGWAGSLLIGVGLTIAVIGVAAVVVGASLIVAAAIAGTTAGVAGASTAISVGGYLAMGGAGAATVGGALNWLDGR